MKAPMPGYHGNADLIAGDRGDISLAGSSPMDLHIAAPGRDPIVASKAKATSPGESRFKVYAASHTRSLPVGAYEVFIREGFSADPDRGSVAVFDASSPFQANAQALRMVDECLM